MSQNISSVQQSENKQLYNRISYTLQKARSVFDNYKRSLSSNWSQCVSELTNLYNYANSLYGQMHPTNGAQGLREDYYGSARQILDQIKRLVDEAQLNASRDSRNSQNDPRTDTLNNGNLGDTIGQLEDLFSTPYKGSDPQMAALYDLYIQLSGQQQQYDWQRESDDLAYNRTNFYTLLSQYQAAGMSRASALAAASGQMPSVAGSSVGASLSPDMLGAALGDTQNQIAQQNADTNSYSAGMTAANEQRRIAIEDYNSRLANLPAEIFKRGFEEIQETWNLTYGLHARNIHVPLYATDSQKAYKDWLLEGSNYWKQVQEGLANGSIQRNDDNGMYYAYDENGDLIESMPPILTDADVQGFYYRKQVYDEIQKHIDSPSYGLMFEQMFMSNAGPRAYHQQEDYSRMMRYRTQADSVLASLDELSASLAKTELRENVAAQFSESFSQSSPEVQSYIKKTMDSLGWVFDPSGRVCTYDEETQNYSLVSVEDMLDRGLITFGFQYPALLNFRSMLQSAKLATDSEHFEKAFDMLHKQDAIAVAQLGMQQTFTEGAAIRISDSTILQKAGALDMIIKMCGFDRAAAAVAGLGFAAFKGGMSIANYVANARERSSHHITESYDANGNLSISESFLR